jgi:hypothetical protein
MRSSLRVALVLLAPTFVLSSGSPAPIVLLGPDHSAITFGGDMPHVRVGDHDLAMACRSVGRSGTPVALATAPLALRAGQRVERQLAPSIHEWWTSSAAGLEHGLTLDTRPPGEGALEVTIEADGVDVSVRGADPIALVSGAGRVFAQYAGLVVLDAHGGEVPARMAAIDPHTILIEVEDAGAAYPLVIDPLLITEEGAVLPPGPELGDGFGTSIASTPGRLVVGVPGRSVDERAGAGMAIVFDTEGVVQATLIPAAPVAARGCGTTVAASLDGLRVALGCDDGALLFSREGGTWVQEQAFAGSGDAVAVALSDDGSRAAIASPGSRSTDVYRRTGTSWALEQTIAITSSAAARTVALSGDGTRLFISDDGNRSIEIQVRTGTTWAHERAVSVARRNSTSCPAATPLCRYPMDVDATGAVLVVGSPGSGGSDGGAQVFARTDTTWTSEWILAGVLQNLGSAVAISDDGSVVALGATRTREVITATRSAGFWTVGASTTGVAGTAYGNAVALDAAGGSLMVGAHDENIGTVASGRVRRYAGSTAAWTLARSFRHPGLATRDFYGASLATNGDGRWAIIGAPGATPAVDDTPTGGPGTAFVFERVGDTFRFDSELPPPPRWAADSSYGFAAAISAAGDRVVIAGAGATSGAACFVRSPMGWSLESDLVVGSGTTGPYSASMSAAGDRAVVAFGARGVHVLTRTGSTWTEEAVLDDASITSGVFGHSAGMSHDGLRAWATAIADFGTYSVRIFVRSGTTWAEEARLAEPTATNFGRFAAMDRSGSRLVVSSGGSFPGDPVGRVFVYLRSGSTWSREAILATPSGADPSFGAHPSIDGAGTRIAVGWPRHGAGGPDSGSVLLYARSGATWLVDGPPFRSVDTADEDYFGWRTALSHDGSELLVAALGAALPYAPATGTFPFRDAPGNVLAFHVRSPLGSACSGAGECDSGFCVDGFCCDSSCGDGAADCEACAASMTGGLNGACGALSGAVAASVVCRASAGACEPEERCAPGNRACPADTGLSSAGSVCRAPIGACDEAEICTGVDVDCPIDAFRPGASVCRGSAGACDLPEVCSGASPSCPSDGFAVADSVCRPAADACDAVEVCNGASAACPGDAFQPAGVNCGGGLPGSCAGPGVCTGASPLCPGPGVLTAGTVCLTAAGPCDVDDICDGTSPLCTAMYVGAGVLCAPSAGGVCDAPDLCTGSSADCPPAYLSAVECRSSRGSCDPAETCLGSSADCPSDAVTPAGTVCRSTTDLRCDPLESCDGTSMDCPADQNTCSAPDGGLPVDAGFADDATTSVDVGPPPPAVGCACRSSPSRRSHALGLLCLALIIVRRRSSARRGCAPRRPHYLADVAASAASAIAGIEKGGQRSTQGRASSS